MYYKIVKQYNGKLFSAMKNELPTTFSTEYKVGEWVESPVKGSKLFVFNELSTAKFFLDFVCGHARHDMYECEIDGKYKGKNLLYIELCNGSDIYIKQLWAKFFNKKKFTNYLSNESNRYIKHTVWASRVKLTKKI